MGSNDSKLNSSSNTSNAKFKKLNSKQDKNCFRKLVKKSLNSILNTNHRQTHRYHDLNYLKWGSNSSNDLTDSTSSVFQPYKKLINQEYVDDLSHDSIASSFVFTPGASYNPTLARPSQFYNYQLVNPNQHHVRVYHDIYYF